MKILIVSIHIKNSPQAMPLAAAMLKSRLDSEIFSSAEVQTEYLDFFLDDSAEDITEKVAERAPDMLGFSVYLWNRELTLKTAALIKNRVPGTTIFAGGAEATAAPQTLLATDLFSFVIKGEGEEALTAVVKEIVEHGNALKKACLAPLPGVYLKDQEKSPEDSAWPVEKLDSLPSPYLTGTIKPTDYEGLLWELSRGCPFKCAFCYESKGVAGVRQFSLERIEQELALFEGCRVNQIFVLDPTFNRDKERAKQILRMITEIAPTIHFTFEIRTEFLDEEMAELFGAINCGLQIGLQSAHSSVLKKVNRNLDPEKYREQIDLLNMAGVTFGLDLIIGLPGDSLEGFKESMDYALSLQPNNLDIFPLSVLPGTQLAEMAAEYELNHQTEAPYRVTSTPGFSPADLVVTAELTEACELFYNKGGAVGWLFMILETLQLSGADFFTELAGWLKENSGARHAVDRSEVTEVQLDFLKDYLTKIDRNELFPALEDLVNYHSALDRSLYAGPLSAAELQEYNEETFLCLAPGTIAFSLNYPLEALELLGEIRLEELVGHYAVDKTSQAIYNCGGETLPLILEEEWQAVLMNFNGLKTLGEVMGNFPHFTPEEFCEFVDFLLGETIVYISG